MCLIVLAYQADPKYPLLVAANRDEFYRRLSDPITFWGDTTRGTGNMLAGRDHSRGGVWLGITRSGRFAAVTNVRGEFGKKAYPISRGDLAKDFLLGHMSPQDYFEQLAEPHLYGGFHLLLGDISGMFHFSNRVEGLRPLEPGIHGISNHMLDDSWPKTETSKRGLKKLVEQGQIDHQSLQRLMAQQPIKAENMNSNLEHAEQNPFLWGEEYGTCASSSLIVSRGNIASPRVSMREVRYDAGGIESTNRQFDFQINA